MYLCHLQMFFISCNFCCLEDRFLVRGRHLGFLSLELTEKIKHLHKAISVTFSKMRCFGVIAACPPQREGMAMSG